MRKFFVAVLCVAAVFMGGCQPTPESEIVVGKDVGAFESRLAETAEGQRSDGQTAVGQTAKGQMAEAQTGDSAENPHGEGADSVEKTERLKDEFTVANGKVKVVVDANVTLLTGNKPVYRVRPRKITAEEVKAWTAYFFPGHKVYERGVVLSREDISKKILKLRSAMESEELYEEWGGNEQALAEIQQDYKEQIANLEKLYESAPETSYHKETDWEFKPYTYFDEDGLGIIDGEDSDLTENMCLVSDYDDYKSTVSAATRDGEDYMINNITYYYLDDSEFANVENHTTEEEAKKLINDAIQKIGLDGWTVDLCSPYKYGSMKNDGWIITCRKFYDGIPLNNTSQLSSIKGEGEYAARYYYEALSFDVYNDKIVSAQLTSPMEVVTIENENANILSFDEAFSRFKEQLSVMYTDAGEEQGIRIRRIDQNLVRVKIPNNEKEYYLIPSWSFYPFARGQLKGEEQIDGPLVCINGVDGSVIDMVLGY